MSTPDEMVHTIYQLEQCIKEIREAVDVSWSADENTLWTAVGRVQELLDHYAPLPEEPETPTDHSMLDDIPF